jgi:predicted dehydrogenase
MDIGNNSYFTNMNKQLILIGFGYFGNVIKQKLENLGNVIIVDPVKPEAHYKTLSAFANARSNAWQHQDTYFFVATPASTHYAVLLELIEQVGAKNIWVEKPVCLNVKDTGTILQMCEQKGINLYCDFTWLQHEVVLYIIEAIKSRTVQEVYMAIHNTGDYAPKDTDIVMDLMPHPVSVLVKLMGENINHALEGMQVKCMDKLNRHIVAYKLGTFILEVKNGAPKKLRDIVVIFEDNGSISWSSDQPNMALIDGKDYVALENNGDALDRHIHLFMDGSSNEIDVVMVAKILCDIQCLVFSNYLEF